MPKTEFQQEQEWALKSKPYLRFRPGDIVFFKSDFEKKNPMVIVQILDIDFPEDYSCSWFDSKNCKQGDIFFDITLTKSE